MKILTKLLDRKKDIWLKSPFVKKSKKQALRISKTSNHWYCFETQKGGNLTDFVKALSKVNYKKSEETKWIPISKKPKHNGWAFLCRDTDDDDTRMVALGLYEDEWLEPDDLTGLTHYVMIEEPKTFPKIK